MADSFPDAVDFAGLWAAAPEIADGIAERFESTNLCLIGTNRADGSPRVSPFEIRVADGRMFIGSMPGALKARDLQRDPRCCVLTPVADADDRTPEGKLFALARELTDPVEIAAAFSAFGPDPVDPAALDGSHAFELRITGAALQGLEGETWVTRSWSLQDGVRLRRRHGANGLPEEVDV